MNEFKSYHPIVNLVYFVFVIGFSCVFMNPMCIMVSFISAFVYSIILNGKTAAKNNLKYIIPIIIIMSIINPAFNHEGVTIIWYFPNGNPLTLESILYGVSASFMIITVILWFTCHNSIMTDDKIIYLFGKIMPSLSLILSMTLRFVPRFKSQLKIVINSQKCIGCDISNGSLINRMKNGISVLSVMITWALENSIQTADSMKSRGYGLYNRTAFSIFCFELRDIIALCFILFFGIYTLIGYILGGMYFKYFPSVIWGQINLYYLSLLFSYTLLCICPIIIEICEVRRWKYIRSRI